MTKPVRWDRATVEYVRAQVAADVDLDQTVELAVTDGHPAEDDWLPAVWEGDLGTSRVARTSSPLGPLDPGPYQVRVRLTDSPEVPVVLAGVLYVS